MLNYRCYDDGKEPNLWQRWYDGEAEKRGRAKHDFVFGVLEQLPRSRWLPLHFKKIQGQEGVFEVLIATNFAWRILVTLSQDNSIMTVLLTCNHKGNVYDPREALQTAGKRRRDLDNGTAQSKKCDRPGKTA